MSTRHRTPKGDVPQVLVATDVAKDLQVVLIATPTQRRVCTLPNTKPDVEHLISELRTATQPVRIGFEPTGVYHRPLAYQLVTAGFGVVLISSLARSGFREARVASWGKNDPEDAGVLLDLSRQGIAMRFVDPIVAGWNDVQEVSKTYWQLTPMRTRVQHSLLTHYLPLYWPEVARYWHTSRRTACTQTLLVFPMPASIVGMDRDTRSSRARWTRPGERRTNASGCRACMNWRTAPSACRCQRAAPRCWRFVCACNRSSISRDSPRISMRGRIRCSERIPTMSRSARILVLVPSSP